MEDERTDLESLIHKGKVAVHKRLRAEMIDGENEAHLVALMCGDAPDGLSRWTLRLLGQRMVDNAYVEHRSRNYSSGVKKRVKTLAKPGKLIIHYTPKHGSWLNMTEINTAFYLGNVWIDVFRTKRH